MFLTYLWQTGTVGTSLQGMISSFISLLGKKLSVEDRGVKTLGRTILSALTTLETVVPGSLDKDKGLNCTDLWLFALDSDPENLLDACTFYLGPITLLTPLILFSGIR